MTNLAVPVILFKTPSHPFASDPYHLLAQDAYEPKSIPVLKEIFLFEQLKRVVEQGVGGYEGVVIMSRRGAEGWVKTMQLLNDAKGDHAKVITHRLCDREEQEDGRGISEPFPEPFKSTHRQCSYCSRFQSYSN